MISENLKQKIGQMVFVGISKPGDEFAPACYVDRRTKYLIEQYHIGNFGIFGRNIENLCQTVGLCASLTELVLENTRALEPGGVAPIFTLDQEGGMVSRIYEGASLISGQMALGGATPPVMKC